jgi:hypothetical protein
LYQKVCVSIKKPKYFNVVIVLPMTTSFFLAYPPCALIAGDGKLRATQQFPRFLRSAVRLRWGSQIIARDQKEIRYA